MMKKNPSKMVVAATPLTMYAMRSPLAKVVQRGRFPRDEVGNEELKLGLFPSLFPSFILLQPVNDYVRIL